MLWVTMLAALGFDAGGPWGQRMREEGRLQLGRLSEMSRLPASGACWKDAVRRLHGSCDGLSSDAQASVALSLTDCFLEASGRPATGCGDAEDRVHCTASMASEAFQAYTVFYTHAQSICFFLRGELWHEETERTIERLAAASAQVSSHMESVSRFMDVSHESVMLAIAELQSWSLGEAAWFRGVLFYVAALAVAFVVTAAPRTGGARPWVCLILTLNLLLECSALTWAVSHFGGTAEEQSLWGKSWAVLSRKVAATVCFTVIVAKVLLYRDYTSENNRLLRDLKTDTTQLLGELKKTDRIVKAREKLRGNDASGELKHTDRISNSWESPRVATVVGEVRVTDGYLTAWEKRKAATVMEEVTAEADGYEEYPSERPKSRAFLRGYSPYRRLESRYSYTVEQLQRSSTPLSDEDSKYTMPLAKRDFYTPERDLTRARSSDPRLNATPVVLIRPLELEERSRRGSSVGSNVSTHSYSLRSVQR